MLEDKILVCRDCGAEFVFTAGEQEFFAQKGFAKAPVRCTDCRKRRKRSAGGRESVVLYEIVCAKCGEVEKIPFEPKHSKPVYCAKCYAEMKDRA